MSTTSILDHTRDVPRPTETLGRSLLLHRRYLTSFEMDATEILRPNFGVPPLVTSVVYVNERATSRLTEGGIALAVYRGLGRGDSHECLPSQKTTPDVVGCEGGSEIHPSRRSGDIVSWVCFLLATTAPVSSETADR